jgi:hypothetical protein
LFHRQSWKSRIGVGKAFDCIIIVGIGIIGIIVALARIEKHRDKSFEACCWCECGFDVNVVVPVVVEV